jgi:hypothetical protein
MFNEHKRPLQFTVLLFAVLVFSVRYLLRTNPREYREKLVFLNFSEQVAPFLLGVQSLNANQGGAIGFNLDYAQVPCQ